MHLCHCRLNRSTLQFDEAAYARLEQYLAESASLLEGDPDPQEILNDLEQAVADQCTRRMAAGQTIVTLAQLAPALAEIGAVQVPGSGTQPAVAARRGTGCGAAAAAGQRRRRDQRRVPGARTLLCAGRDLAARHRRDIAGRHWRGMIPVYLALMLLMPYAPLETGGKPLRWLPAKCRSFVEFLRAKLGVEQTGNIPA